MKNLILFIILMFLTTGKDKKLSEVFSFNLNSFYFPYDTVQNIKGYSINNSDKWARIPQIDGTFRLISVEEAKLLYLMENRGRVDSIKVDFHLYTRSNPENGQIIDIDDVDGLNNSTYNRKLSTRFIIHGWRNNFNSSVNNILRKAYLAYENLNIFVVDWSSAAQTINYYSARYSVAEVGTHIAKYLEFLHQYGGMSYVTLKLIGHSLGAHCAGYAGKTIGNGKIHTIIGLDPAWPLFSYNEPSERLNATDASYVETIHTSGGTLGFYEPIGKASFYPNWGIKQPGCGIDITGKCSHQRAYQLFSEAITENKFLPKKCESHEKFLQQECDINVKKVKMGKPTNHIHANGIYFVPTNAEEPYGHGKVI